MNTTTDPFGIGTTEIQDTAPQVDDSPRATEKQWSYITSLATQVQQQGHPDENVRTVVGTILTTEREDYNRKAASGLIDLLKNYLREARQAPAPVSPQGEAPEGIHALNAEEIYKVQVAVHGSGKKYAKQLNVQTGNWDYVGRAPLARLSEATLMTLEQAKEFGHLYGMCVRCGATLTDEGSIAAGIGPVCATKF